MDSKHKLKIADDADYGTVYVKVTAKSANVTGSNVTSYRVYRKPAKDSSVIDITYAGNVQKGTATIIVTGDGIDGVGSKTATFKIK